MLYNKVLLINPYGNLPGTNVTATLYPPLGLAYLASVLRNNNIQVKIIDTSALALSNEQVMKIVFDEKPELVGISINIATARSGVELSKCIKKTTKIDVCLGGPFVSSNTKHVLKSANADIAVIGEGENTLLEICRGKYLSEIKGVAWRSADDNIIINEPADLIQNLDDLPIPAYDLFPPFKLYRSRTRKVPMASILTSRGCPYNCTFCNHNIFGNKFRAFSPKRVAKEIEYLISRFGIRQLDIVDDTFTQDISRTEEILDLIIKKKLNIVINLNIGVRADTITYPIVKKMKQAGVIRVAVGCESGNKKILKEIKKNIDLKRVKQTINWLRKEKIASNCFFILGFPNDTKKTVWDTINFAVEANPSTATFSILMPFPGTEIYSYLKNNNLLNKNITNGVDSGFFSSSNIYHRCLNLTSDEIANLHSIAYKRFYLRFSKIIYLIREIRSFNELKFYFNLIKSSGGIIKKFY
ncbi:MAG: radical SAM protein [Candidatus Omnitrophica bacterium]|nr:radical SAM protein [Candidatus Omnitrophota bacterium]